MRIGAWIILILLSSQVGLAQTKSPNSAGVEQASSELPSASYAVLGATPEQEAILRSQIQIMHPAVAPLRVFFVPHWKYLDAARAFHLHVPAGYGSLMFTHLPSRTVFIDSDRYDGEKWLGYWIAHELGHLKLNSAKEGDAEKAAREFRNLLANSRKASS